MRPFRVTEDGLGPEATLVERMLELTGLADDPWVFDDLDEVKAKPGLPDPGS